MAHLSLRAAREGLFDRCNSAALHCSGCAAPYEKHHQWALSRASLPDRSHVLRGNADTPLCGDRADIPARIAICRMLRHFRWRIETRAVIESGVHRRAVGRGRPRRTVGAISPPALTSACALRAKGGLTGAIALRFIVPAAPHPTPNITHGRDYTPLSLIVPTFYVGMQTHRSAVTVRP